MMGRNGAGKTTTVRSIVGWTPPRQGRIRLKDVDITRLPPHEIARQGIGIVPQGRRIFRSLTVQEHLAMAAHRAPGGPWSAAEVLELFPPQRNRLHNRGSHLSGGEQSMLAIGRA